MRPLLQAEVLAPEVPADVHQLHGIERRAAAPRLAGGMSALALEAVLDRHQAVAAVVAPRVGTQVVVDMAEHGDVDILEVAVAHEPRFRSDELLGDAGPHFDRSGQVLALHDFSHGEDRRDVHCLSGVMTLAVAWRALDDRIVIRDTRLLRRLRNAVDVRADRDHRLATAPRRHPRRGDAGDAAFDLESVLFEDAREVFRRLDLLEAELAEAEHLIDDLLRELA